MIVSNYVSYSPLCQNGGRCESDSSSSFTCICAEGYSGDLCDVEPVVECRDAFCSSQGECNLVQYTIGADGASSANSAMVASTNHAIIVSEPAPENGVLVSAVEFLFAGLSRGCFSDAGHLRGKIHVGTYVRDVSDSTYFSLIRSVALDVPCERNVATTVKLPQALPVEAGQYIGVWNENGDLEVATSRGTNAVRSNRGGGTDARRGTCFNTFSTHWG